MRRKTAVNRIIRALIISDFFLFFGLGLLAPIFAIFILEHIENRLEVVGIAAAVYWATRVLLVIPLSRLMDKRKGHADEYLFMICGTFLISLVPLFYIFATTALHIYLIQVLYGLASSMAVPAWRILFTNYIDKPLIGFEWSLEDVGIGIATATSAIIGAYIADLWGFKVLFTLISLFGMCGTAIVFYIYAVSPDSLIRLPRRDGEAPLKVDTIK